MQKVKLLPLILLLSLAAPAHASAELDGLWNQGKWSAAATQAAQEKDFLTAALALHRLQECPSPAQPNGQVWSEKLSAQGVAYTRAALNTPLNTDEKITAYLTLGNLLGLQAYDLTDGGVAVATLRDALSLVRQSKAAYESGLQLRPSDGLMASSYALWHARGYARAGAVIGASLTEARHWLYVGQQAFNRMPENNKAQMLDKAWTAFRLAVALESQRDKRMQPYFEAAIKLGEQAGNADGRCVANVSRVHLGRPVTNF